PLRERPDDVRLLVTHFIERTGRDVSIDEEALRVFERYRWKAALLKQSIEKAKATQTPDAADMRFREIDMDKFALRCFNTLSHDREISGVQIANSLLQLPTYTNLVTIVENFSEVNQLIRIFSCQSGGIH